MTEEEHGGLKDRLSRQGEEALGRLADELVGNPFVSAALSRAFEAREKAAQAQEVAMGALNIPSAADVERLTRRIRSISQRLEGIEEALDRLETRLASTVEPAARAGPASAARLDEIAPELAAIPAAIGPGHEPLPTAQERMTVSGS